MAFVLKEIQDSERHLYSSRRFLNPKGVVTGTYYIAVDEERDMFLIKLGGGGSVANDPDLFLFHVNGIYIKFDARYEFVEKSIEPTGMIFTTQFIPIPMNMAARTNQILDHLNEAVKSLLGTIGKPLDRNLLIRHIHYQEGQWPLEPKRDIIMYAYGPQGHYETFQERDTARFYFSQGRREKDSLYNFRLWYEGIIIDFQAYYRLTDQNRARWELKEAAVPRDFAGQTDMLVQYLPEGLKKFSAQADPLPMLAPDLSTMAIAEGTEEVRTFGTFGSRFYPLKYSDTVSEVDRKDFFVLPQDFSVTEENGNVH